VAKHAAPAQSSGTRRSRRVRRRPKLRESLAFGALAVVAGVLASLIHAPWYAEPFAVGFLAALVAVAATSAYLLAKRRGRFLPRR
jgi:hypothetical protein